MLAKIQKSIKVIILVIIKLNMLYDKERKHLEKLEEVLNMLGKLGYSFEGDSFQNKPNSSDITDLSLAFINGKICILERGWFPDRGDFSYKNPLSQIALRKVDDMLLALPKFLEEYQKFLSEKEAAHEQTLDQLTQIVVAISAIIAK